MSPTPWRPRQPCACSTSPTQSATASPCKLLMALELALALCRPASLQVSLSVLFDLHLPCPTFVCSDHSLGGLPGAPYVGAFNYGVMRYPRWSHSADSILHSTGWLCGVSCQPRLHGGRQLPTVYP